MRNSILFVDMTKNIRYFLHLLSKSSGENKIIIWHICWPKHTSFFVMQPFENQPLCSNTVTSYNILGFSVVYSVCNSSISGQDIVSLSEPFVSESRVIVFHSCALCSIRKRTYSQREVRQRERQRGAWPGPLGWSVHFLPEREDLGTSLLLYLARCLGKEAKMLFPCYGIFSAI